MTSIRQIRCHNFDSGRCRSCDELAGAVGAKWENLRRLLFAAGLQDIKIANPVVVDSVFRSRAKAKMTVAGTSAFPVIGFTTRERLTRELLDCPLHLDEINRVLQTIKRLIAVEKIDPYDIERRTGELKALLLTSTADAQQLILRFVLRSKFQLSKIRKLLDQLYTLHPAVKVASANIQPKPAAILEGDEEIVLTAERFIKETSGDSGVELSYGVRAFHQVTPEIAFQLYKTAANWLRTINARRILDLYCGVGGFLLHCANDAERGVGVELSANAIECANRAALRNGFSNLQWVSLDVDVFVRQSTETFDAAIVNPPRRGLSQSVLNYLLKSGFNNVCYSSCDPETLVRDLKSLRTGYEIEKIIPFDMFPLTSHMECLAFLRSKP
jgi:23S rRNA (uracil747-C5)-methyltransferase